MTWSRSSEPRRVHVARVPAGLSGLKVRDDYGTVTEREDCHSVGGRRCQLQYGVIRTGTWGVRKTGIHRIPSSVGFQATPNVHFPCHPFHESCFADNKN